MDWPRILSVAADVMSLISFIITVAVWWSVRRIREFYRFRARIPAVIARLNKKASNLSTFLSDYDASTHSIELELAEAAVLLRSLANKSSGRPKAAASKLAKRIEQRQISTASDTRQVYVALRKLLVTFQEVQKDYSWEP